MVFKVTVFNRLQQTNQTVEESLNYVTDKAHQVSDDWKQTATQSMQNAILSFTNTVEQSKSIIEPNLQQIPVQNFVSYLVIDWFEQHPAFLRIIKSFNWSINHPIISLIIILFILALFWSLIKAILSLIESASLSILQIPLKLCQNLIKYIWRSLSKLSNFASQKTQDTKTINNTLEIYQLQHNSTYQIFSDSKQQRLKYISTRLDEIQTEQQQLLQEAADIIISEQINSSVN